MKRVFTSPMAFQSECSTEPFLSDEVNVNTPPKGSYPIMTNIGV